jgi:hypothetical protein
MRSGTTRASTSSERWYQDAGWCPHDRRVSGSRRRDPDIAFRHPISPRLHRKIQDDRRRSACLSSSTLVVPGNLSFQFPLLLSVHSSVFRFILQRRQCSCRMAMNTRRSDQSGGRPHAPRSVLAHCSSMAQLTSLWSKPWTKIAACKHYAPADGRARYRADGLT